jgi:hypothetical protein
MATSPGWSGKRQRWYTAAVVYRGDDSGRGGGDIVGEVAAAVLTLQRLGRSRGNGDITELREREG